MKTFFKIIPVPFLLIFTPLVASAEFLGDRCGDSAGLIFLLCRMTSLLNSTLPFLVSLGVVYLVWGVVQYVIGDSDEAKKKGRDKIVSGIIGLVVIIGLWGLVYIVLETFGSPDEYSAPTDLDKLLPRSPQY